MKRSLTFMLIAAMLFAFCGCAVKNAVQEGTHAILEGITGQDESSDVQPSDTPHESEKPTISNGGLPPIAPIPEGASYWERLEYEWRNAPAEGYVWTITIDSADVIDVLGLATANYNVHLSASHIGEDMYGAYFGEFAFDSSTDMSGLEALVTAWSGDMEYDTDIWFKNERFVFSLDRYDEMEEQQLETAVVSGSEYEGMSPEEQAFLGSLLGDVYKNEMRDFESAGQPSAMWWDFDMGMTDGDLGASLGFYGIAGGTVSGFASTDSTGHDTEAVVHSIVGTFRESSSLKDKFGERYGDKENFTYPMPYTLKVYPGGQVVMTFYSLDGSPVTIKCYGTIDKVAVEDTIELPNG